MSRPSSCICAAAIRAQGSSGGWRSFGAVAERAVLIGTTGIDYWPSRVLDPDWVGGAAAAPRKVEDWAGFGVALVPCGAEGGAAAGGGVGAGAADAAAGAEEPPPPMSEARPPPAAPRARPVRVTGSMLHRSRSGCHSFRRVWIIFTLRGVGVVELLVLAAGVGVAGEWAAEGQGEGIEGVEV